ncbi:hypothetical protein CLOM_g18602 [Closterium sp. NIES-68]|nr:hypothetical protein CLOM_g18602 [Closterium sp. NIES-68]GJP86091.1 hypothetical protein CLOP_g16150 [Closterium sp. NIES-67]
METAWNGTSCGMQSSPITVHEQHMPLPELHKSFATTEFQLFCAIYMVLSLIPMLQVAITQIVQEKESLLKDCMLLMGLRESVYWLAWLLTYAFMAVITSAVISLTVKLTSLFSASTFVALFCIIFPYSLSLIALAFALSTLFTQVGKAAAAAAGSLLLCSLLVIPIQLLSLGAAYVYPLLLLSPVPFTIAITTVTRAEGMGQGVSLSSFWLPRVGVNPGDDDNIITIGACIFSFIFDTALYLFLAWYLDNVWPHPQRGPKKPANFVFSAAYWFPARHALRYTQLGEEGGGDDTEHEGEECRLDVGQDSAAPLHSTTSAPLPAAMSSHNADSAIEDVRGFRPALLINHLSKSFRPRGLHSSSASSSSCLSSFASFFTSRTRRASAATVDGDSAAAADGTDGADGAGGAGGAGGSSGHGDERRVLALQGLSLTLYEGQSFAFLGHSGSGKSTVLSMLAGLQKPNEGEAFLYGLSLTKGDSYIHSLVGHCPQRNIHVAVLTVKEQLTFFAEIKGDLDRLSAAETEEGEGEGEEGEGGEGGQQLQQQGGRGGWRLGAWRLGREKVRQAVGDLMFEMGLQGWADRPAFELSPSQQRKLSLSIALIGEPQVLLLDEPTKGMDPSSKKQVWDLLQRRKAGRVVVFTTHSMEEADLAADRKAILSHGRLKCCGSSLFLRNRFGLSYLLHITKGAVFKGSKVVQLVQSHVPDAVLMPSSGLHQTDYATYSLPFHAASHIPALLLDLSSRAAELGVEDAAMEATTLEEVFLKFQDEDEEAAGAILSASRADASAMDFVMGMGAGAGALAEEDEGQSLLDSPGASDSAAAGAGSSGERRREENGRGGGGSGAGAASGGGSGTTVGSAVGGAAGLVSEGAARDKPLAVFRRQVKGVCFLRAASYWRNTGNTLSTFGLPVIFAVAALLIQLFGSSVTSPSLLLTAPQLATDSAYPVIYSATSPASAIAAKQLLDRLGENHAQLGSEQAVLERFQTDVANAERNGVGSKAVGVLFQGVDMSQCAYSFTLLYQPWRIHQVPAVIATLNNAFLRLLAAQHDIQASPQSITVESYPLHFSSPDFVFAYIVAAVVAIGLLMVPPILSAQVVAEMEYGLRTMLKVCGMRGFALWLGTAVVDCFAMWLCTLLITAVGLCFQSSPFTVPALPALFVVFAITIPALVLLSYLLSFSFDSAQLAAATLSLLFLLLAVIPFVFMLRVSPASFSIPHGLLSLLSPPYALMSSLHFIAAAYAHEPLTSSPLDIYSLSATDYYSLHYPAYPVQVSMTSVVIAVVLMALRLGQLHRDWENQDEEGAGDLAAMMGPGYDEESGDGDVVREKERVQESAAKWDFVQSGGEEGDLVLCSSVGKNFGASSGVCGIGKDPGVWAVSNLWLGVPRGQVVVLVGGEKAGKTALLQCLAGASCLSYGNALINGQSVRFTNLNDPSIIGYCPQADMMHGFLSVQEYLHFMASVKGLREPLSAPVTHVLQSLGISPSEASQRIDACRSGLLRRVAVAAALLGDPAVLLLDEPSQAMDIASRRLLWGRILSDAPHRATLIATHSVEEAEALGSRVGILVRGQLKCLGSPQALKARYGSAYTLLLSAQPRRLPAIRAFLSSVAPTFSEHYDDDAAPLPISSDHAPHASDYLHPDAPALMPSAATGGAGDAGSLLGGEHEDVALQGGQDQHQQQQLVASPPPASVVATPAAAAAITVDELSIELSDLSRHNSDPRPGPPAIPPASPAAGDTTAAAAALAAAIPTEAAAGGATSAAAPPPASPATEAGAGSSSSSGCVQVKFLVPVDDLRGLARVWSELEGQRARLGIEEMSFSQPTLQQVFHRLTRVARDQPPRPVV